MNDDEALREELQRVYTRPTDEELLRESVEEKLAMVSANPGLEVAFDPDEAEFAGAFVEDALSAEEAMASALLGEMPNP